MKYLDEYRDAEAGRKLATAIARTRPPSSPVMTSPTYCSSSPAGRLASFLTFIRVTLTVEPSGFRYTMLPSRSADSEENHACVVAIAELLQKMARSALGSAPETSPLVFRPPHVAVDTSGADERAAHAVAD